MIPGISLTSAMAKKQLQANDLQNAQTIGVQMQADAQKQQMQRWQILEDTQTKIQQLQQEVTVNRAKTQDKIHNKWDQYIRG
ncbi:MAG: hypothetical protein ACYCW6_27870 [Candidatus Xenobia bacterium]